MPLCAVCLILPALHLQPYFLGFSHVPGPPRCQGRKPGLATAWGSACSRERGRGLGRSRQGRWHLHRPLGILLTFPAPGRIDASAFELAVNAQGLKNRFCGPGVGEGPRLLREVSPARPRPRAWHLNEDRALTRERGGGFWAGVLAAAGEGCNRSRSLGHPDTRARNATGGQWPGPPEPSCWSEDGPLSAHWPQPLTPSTELPMSLACGRPCQREGLWLA